MPALGDGLAGLSLYASNYDDPNIKQNEADLESIEDFAVKPTDNLIILGQADEESCRLEIYGTFLEMYQVFFFSSFNQ